MAMFKRMLADFPSGGSEFIETTGAQLDEIIGARRADLLATEEDFIDLLTLCFLLRKNELIGLAIGVKYNIHCLHVVILDNTPHHPMTCALTHEAIDRVTCFFSRPSYGGHLKILITRWLSLLDIYLGLSQLPPSSEEVILNFDDRGNGTGLNFCDDKMFDALIPDSYFMGSQGYKYFRDLFVDNTHPWDARSDELFWRGSTTGASGGRIAELPRVRLCLLSKPRRDWDIGIVDIVQVNSNDRDWILAQGINRPRVAPEGFSHYKYHIDIDGNTNSWPGLMIKLLSGGLVFKVQSPYDFRQWYYTELEDGFNFVSVKSDMSDLVEKFEYYRDNQWRAARIAENGRKLAYSLTYQGELRRALDAVCQRMGIPCQRLPRQQPDRDRSAGVVAELPIKFFVKCMVAIGDDALPVAEASKSVAYETFLTKLDDASTIDIIIIDPLFIHHYFHFVEMLFGLVSLHPAIFDNARSFRFHFGSQQWNGTNDVQEKLLSCCFENLQIMAPDTRLVADAVILVDRRLSVYNIVNKFLDPFEEVLSRGYDILRKGIQNKIEHAYGKQGDRPVALYVVRRPPRTLVHSCLCDLKRIVEAYGFEFREVDFSNMAFEQQVERAGCAQLLLGVHGNGLTNLLWLSPGAAVIEFFPPNCHLYDYQILAEGASLTYFGLECCDEGGYIFRSGDREGGHYGDANRLVETLPTGNLSKVLREIVAASPSCTAGGQPPRPRQTEMIDSAPYAQQTFSQFGEDMVLLWYFNGRTDGFYIDVGAHHPFRFSNTALLHTRFGWSGINIDVDQRAIDAFDIARPHDVNICRGVDIDAGLKQVTIFDEGAINSFDRDWVNHAAWAHIGRVEKEVEVSPLRDILGTVLAAGRNVDYMNVDVEQLDLRVIQSNDWSKVRPELLSIETNEIDFDNIHDHPVFKFMQEVGYKMLCHVVGTSFFKRS